MDKEVLIWQNKAAEAEQKRASAQNKANMLNGQAAQMAKALEECRMFIDNPGKYKDNEVAALKGMVNAAAAVYRSQQYQVSEPLRGHQVFASDPPENPKTDDWYYDGKHFHWFYKRGWHKERTE